MVVMYKVAGRQIGSHWLAMATLGTTFAGAYLGLGGNQKAKEAGPPINATSKDEEAFIQEFLKNANAEEQKAKH
ncbi:MAG: hypothetical protein MMC33_004414 [Icmadophila ericetorum]|nr:hypothetical protein [Icmadophila ericetorum]